MRVETAIQQPDTVHGLIYTVYPRNPVAMACDRLQATSSELLIVYVSINQELCYSSLIYGQTVFQTSQRRH